MKLSKTFNLSLNMLLHSKLRSWLTILGIFIGITAVVAIISLSQGLKDSVNSQINSFGQDSITIYSGGNRAMGSTGTTNIKPLSDKDIQLLKLVPGVKSINGLVSYYATVKYLGETTHISIQGYNLAVFKEFVTTDLSSGRYLSSGDTKSVVIGDKIANEIFKTKLNIGSLITIQDKQFRIVGILEPSKGITGGDSNIYMSNKDLRELFPNGTLASNEYSNIEIKVSDPDYITETTAEVEAALMNSHHVTSDKKDFTVVSSKVMQEQLDTIMMGITLFLGVIAAISLLVGGIGVANTMFTSVLEKTRDIGVMKAIGARNNDILYIFLFNSGLLGLVGGLFGIIFTLLISLLISALHISLGGDSYLTMPISFWVMAFAVTFSIAIGMISGAIPAYRASRLKPVDALRYE